MSSFAASRFGGIGRPSGEGMRPQHVENILDLHHHKLDEALGQFGVADRRLFFINFSHGSFKLTR